MQVTLRFSIVRSPKSDEFVLEKPTWSIHFFRAVRTILPDDLHLSQCSPRCSRERVRLTSFVQRSKVDLGRADLLVLDRVFIVHIDVEHVLSAQMITKHRRHRSFVPRAALHSQDERLIPARILAVLFRLRLLLAMFIIEVQFDERVIVTKCVLLRQVSRLDNGNLQLRHTSRTRPSKRRLHRARFCIGSKLDGAFPLEARSHVACRFTQEKTTFFSLLAANEVRR